MFLSFVVLRVLEINHQRPAQRGCHSPSWNYLHYLFWHGTVNYITHNPHSLYLVDGWLKEFSTRNLQTDWNMILTNVDWQETSSEQCMFVTWCLMCLLYKLTFILLCRQCVIFYFDKWINVLSLLSLWGNTYIYWQRKMISDSFCQHLSQGEKYIYTVYNNISMYVYMKVTIVHYTSVLNIM